MTDERNVLLDRDLLIRALYPKVSPNGSELLRQIAGPARERALDVLSACLARPAALELATVIEQQTLLAAREAAAGPVAAVDAARKACDREEHSITERIAAFWSGRAKRAKTSEPEPARESERLRQLREALVAAEDEAAPVLQDLRHREEQVATLRRAPRPDADVLEALGLGRHSACPPKGGGQDATH